MISCSHWGMFYAPRTMIVVPPGFKVSDKDRSEWNKPGGIIRIERA